MSINDTLGNLVNDLAEQVLQQVQGQIQNVITAAVNQRINDILSEDTINSIIVSRVQENLIKYTPDTTQFEKNLQDVGTQIINRLNDTADQKIGALISDRISNINIEDLAQQFITAKLDSTSNHFPFKDSSVPGSSIDIASLRITGDNIKGGVIQNFGSTGIDDQASKCQITVLDLGVVFEDTIFASKLEVKGGAVIDGDLDIQGRIVDSPAYQALVSDVSATVQQNIGPALLDQHQDRVFARILEEGIDLNKITVNGQAILKGDRLINVKDSQLRTVGILQDLQTTGETLLSQTLYTNNKRVGINTLSPANALSIWDEEIEIGVGKSSLGIARLGTVRDHKLIIGSNGQDNITLTPDGTTAVAQLKLGNMLFSSSPTPPHYNADRGTVVFNEQPNLGGPLGWISLGDAKWANFGIVD